MVVYAHGLSGGDVLYRLIRYVRVAVVLGQGQPLSSCAKWNLLVKRVLRVVVSQCFCAARIFFQHLLLYILSSKTASSITKGKVAI